MLQKLRRSVLHPTSGYRKSKNLLGERPKDGHIFSIPSYITIHYNKLSGPANARHIYNKLYKMQDAYIKIHQNMQYELIRQRVSAYISSHDQVLI